MSDSNSSGNWDASPASGDDWGDGGDQFSETSHKSWLERIMESLKAILFGFILVIGSGAFLFWNEGNTAKTAASLAEGSGLVASVPADRVDASKEGKLVHVAGETTAPAPVSDPELSISAAGLKLVRKVEMYQWKEERSTETRKKLGGGEETVTRYSYKREWSDSRIDSSRFRDSSGHQNPQMPRVRSRSFAAQGATLGAFKLDDRVIGQLGQGETFDVPSKSTFRAREVFGDRARATQGAIYVGEDPDAPRVGDIRVTYKLLPVQPVSVVGKQTQSGFTPYVTSNERTILLAETGIQDAKLMFKHAQDANRVFAWIMRFVGVLLMFAGFRMMLTLLQVLADVVPIFGDIVGFGASMVALLATAVVAPVVIAFAWLFYRPVIAGIIFAAGIAIFFGLRQWAAKRAASRTPQARAPMPAGMQGGAAAAVMPPQRPSSGFLPPGFGRRK